MHFDLKDHVILQIVYTIPIMTILHTVLTFDYYTILHSGDTAFTSFV